MKINRKQNGFTIIEVVLVLAIAGLIFMMVFIALPALQRGQRDSARKSDVGIVSSGVVAYTGNNRGAFPNAVQLGTYVTNVSDNTDKTLISIRATGNTAAITVPDSAIVITPGTRCLASTALTQTFSAGTTRQFTVVTRLESGAPAGSSSGAHFCQDN